MSASPISPPRWPLTLLLVSLLIHTSWIIARWGPEAASEWLANLLYLSVTAAAALACWFGSRGHQGRNRRAWLLITLGLACFAVADGLWTWFELLLDIEPFPSAADIFYLIGPVFFLLGILGFSRSQQNPVQRWQLGLDVAISVTAVSILLWPGLLAPVIASYERVSLEMLISLAYPSLDLLLLGLLFSLILRRSENSLSKDKVVLGSGLILIVAGDLIYSHMVVNESYFSGHPVDVLWLTGYASIAASSYLGRTAKERRWHWLERLRLSGLATLVPYIGIGLSYSVLLISQNQDRLVTTGVIIGTGLVSLFVIARQSLAFFENQALTLELKVLSEDLEQRVIQRTTELEESRNRLIASETLASLGRLTAGLAHEINTPLAAARNYLLQAKNLADEYHDSIDIPTVTAADHREIANELHSSLKDSDRSLERLGELVRRMRSHTRSSGTTLDFDLKQTISDTIAMLDHRLRKSNVQLTFEASKEVALVHGDPSRFNQVISNLLVNALDACEEHVPGAGKITVAIKKVNQQVYMSVSDNGGGIPEDLRQRIFEPMFTTKEVGKGTGLGLSIVHNIIKGQFDGDISLKSTPGQGSTFTVILPAVKSSKAPLVTA